MSAAPHPAREPWSRPDALNATSNLPVFPTEALPHVLRDWVVAEAVATQTPEDMAAMLSLTVVGACLAKRVEVQGGADWTEPPNLFTMTVLAPANRKSSVHRHATAPMRRYEAQEAEKMAPLIAEKESELRVLEQRLKVAEDQEVKGKAKDNGYFALQLSREVAEFEVPKSPRLIADDCSPEKLVSLLQDQGGRMAVMSPEGDLVEVMGGRYTQKGAPNFAVFLKGHAGDPLVVDRVGRPPERVDSPNLSLGLTVQPEVLKRLGSTPQFRTLGLVARFLYSIPESPLGNRKIEPPAMPESVARSYADLVTKFLELKPAANEDGTPIPHLIRLDAEARKCFYDFQAVLERKLGCTAELGWLQDWAGKYAGAVLRIAGILHMVEHQSEERPWAVLLNATTISCAMTIGEYLLEHAKAALQELEIDEEAANAKYVLRLIEDRCLVEFSARDLFEMTKGRLRKMPVLKAALASLEESGVVRQIPSEDSGKRGRPASPLYEVNPYVHRADPGFANTANIATGVSRQKRGSEGISANSANIALGNSAEGFHSEGRSENVPDRGTA